MGNLSLGEINVQLWWVQVLTGKNSLVPSAKIISSTLNIGETIKLVYILLKLVGASLEVGVASLMKRILEVCNWRLIVCGGGYAMIDGEGLLRVLTLPLMMRGMITIGLGQGLPLVSLSRVMRITFIRAKIGAHLAKVWGTMP